MEHLHIDLVREGSYPSPPNSWEEKPLNELLSLIEDCLERHSAGTICIDTTGRYSLLCSKLPQEGIIESLLGLGTDAAGALLEVEGTSFSIKKAEPYTELKWVLDPPERLDEEENDPGDPVDEDSGASRTVSIVLISEEHASNISTDLLQNSLNLMEAGLDRFVYEKSIPGHSDGKQSNSSGPDTSPRKAADG